MREWIRLVENADWRAQLRQIVLDAKEKHVELEVEAGMDSILLIHIERMGSRGGVKGAGGEVLSQLCKLADENGLEISLHVAGGMRRLVEFYESFGFEMDMEWHQHETDGTGTHPQSDEDSFGYEVPMYRIPRWDA